MAFRNIYSDDANNLRYGTDAFGDKMVTMRHTLLNVKSTHGISQLRDTLYTEGSGSIENPNQVASYNMKVKNAGDMARLYTVERGKYMAGNSAEVSMAIRFNQNSLDKGNKARWGYFDEKNGFFFQLDEAGLSVGILHDIVGETIVHQKDFNTDKLNGTGPSRHTYDPTQGNIFQIYGSGSYCSISFRIVIIDVNGNQIIQTIHNYSRWGGYTILNPNLFIAVVLSKSSDAEDDKVLELLAGDRQYSMIGQSIHTDSRITSAYRLNFKVTSDGFKPVLSVRRKKEYFGDPINFQGLDISCDEECAYQLRLINNMDGSDPQSRLVDAEFGDIPDTIQRETMLEQDTSTTSVDGGIVIYTGLAHATRDGGINTKDIHFHTIESNQIMCLFIRRRSSEHDIKLSVVMRFDEHW